MKPSTKADFERHWKNPALPSPVRLCYRLAWWMDEAIRIPIWGKRFGLDAIIGLAPVLGDVISLAVACLPVGIALYWRLPMGVVFAMLGAIAVDFVVGSIPLLGDVFDATFKANRHNAYLLHQAWEKHHAPKVTDSVVDI